MHEFQEVRKGHLVQFEENHKWFGCIGFVEDVKEIDGDMRCLIGVPIPERGVAYIYSMKSKDEFEIVGDAVIMPIEEE